MTDRGEIPREVDRERVAALENKIRNAIGVPATQTDARYAAEACIQVAASMLGCLPELDDPATLDKLVEALARNIKGHVLHCREWWREQRRPS